MSCNKEPITSNVGGSSGYLIMIVLYILLAIILGGSSRSY